LKNAFQGGVVCLAALLLTAFPPAEGAAFHIKQEADAYIGCEVVLSLSGDETETPGVSYEWSLTGNVKPIRFGKGGLECRFTPYDAESVSVSVSAIGPAGLLSSASVSLTVKEFAIDISLVEGEPFMLWDPNGKRDVPAEGLIAGEPIRLSLRPVPEYKNKINCRWTTDAATAIRGGGEEPQVTISRNEIGDAEVSVVVTDASGVVLGRGRKNIAVPIARATVEESARRRSAWKQWLEASSLWDAKNFDEALSNAVAASETDSDTLEITEGLQVMRANHARVERSRKLHEEAEALYKKERLIDALKTYRRAQVVWALPGTDDAIRNLEMEIDKLRVNRQQAEWLKDTASAYDQEGFFEDALKYYRQTLTLAPDEAVVQRADRIEKRLASIAQAKLLAEEGRRLETTGQLLDAVGKYKESLNSNPNEELAVHTRELEETIKERRARAGVLRREAAELQKKKNNDAEALLRYKESQALWPDPDLVKRIAELEKIVTTPRQVMRSAEDFGIGTQADAARLFQEAHALYKQGKFREALDIYRKSYAISKDERLATWIGRVESSLKEYEAVLQANALIKEGNRLYSEGRARESLVKYRESLVIHRNDEVENFIRFVEENLKKNGSGEKSGGLVTRS
jgi:tetratricopeptide (TPR) repeat protein